MAPSGSSTVLLRRRSRGTGSSVVLLPLTRTLGARTVRGMGIGVLGPVVCDDGVAFGRRDRAVLTALAIRVGQPVSEDRLTEAVWGEDPPRSAHKSLQGCVFRIRQALGSDVIRTSPQGYVLALPADDVDSRRFERLVGRGRELLALGEPERAAYLLGEALGLWRGTPFQDLELSDLAGIEAERLEELRREAEELRVEASLRTGRHLEVLATAEAMVREAPLRERRWQLLALAQYQAGRQTEALRTVNRVKRVLAEQLGIDPGPELAALEEAILRQDDSLLAGGPVPTTGSCPYRGLLPFDLDDHEAFFGRDDDVRACLDILRERGAVSVVGPSGSGKSSLARAGIAAALRLQGAQGLRHHPWERPGRDAPHPPASLGTHGAGRGPVRGGLLAEPGRGLPSGVPRRARPLVRARAARRRDAGRPARGGFGVPGLRPPPRAEPVPPRRHDRGRAARGRGGARPAVRPADRARTGGRARQRGRRDGRRPAADVTRPARDLEAAGGEHAHRRGLHRLRWDPRRGGKVRRGGVRRHRAGAAGGAPRPGAEAGELRHAGRAGTRPATATAVLGGARPPAADRPAGRLATGHE